MGYEWQWEDEASAFEAELFNQEMELMRAEDLFADYKEEGI